MLQIPSGFGSDPDLTSKNRPDPDLTSKNRPDPDYTSTNSKTCTYCSKSIYKMSCFQQIVKIDFCKQVLGRQQTN